MSYIYISIPYGAIKRMVQAFRDGRQNLISIPYGAIKSKALTKKINGAYKFQFLMVRLKVIKRTKPDLLAHISIPYGAIKRVVSGCCFLACAVFQFLMVRLKGFFIIFFTIFFSISIPYGAIKSQPPNVS